MYISVMFIIYIAAAFIALLGIGIVLLLISKSENRGSKQYRTVMSFAAIVFAQCILYFFFYFRDIVMGKPAVIMPLRIIDYVICGGIYLFWLRVIGVLEENRKSRIGTWAWITGGGMGIPGIAATVFFMDDFYCFDNAHAAEVFSVIEIACVAAAVFVTSKYTFDFVRGTTDRIRKIYVTVVSVALMVWSIQQIFIDTSLYLGIYKSAWLNGEADFTGTVMFICGLATFIYLFREDFSPLFYAKPENDGEENPLEAAAEQHGLTVRELEVMQLVYEGRNNPEIAEELCISRNTVKKHLQSIYEKTGTSSRMELIYIINMKNK